MTQVAAPIPTQLSIKDDAMGKVVVEVELFNCFDQEAVRLGQKKPEEVRSTKVSTLVDTGATLLSIPEEAILKLGLPVFREATSRFANGQTAVCTIYGPLMIRVMGRIDSVLALASHPGMPALLGQLPLEGLDLIVDPKRQRLLPGHPDYPNEQLVGWLGRHSCLRGARGISLAPNSSPLI
jgi:predicted aspartyl protease